MTKDQPPGAPSDMGPKKHPVSAAVPTRRPRYLDYYAVEPSHRFQCQCGWVGPFSDLGTEHFKELFEASCPSCGTTIAWERAGGPDAIERQPVFPFKLVAVAEVIESLTGRLDRGSGGEWLEWQPAGRGNWARAHLPFGANWL